MKKLIISLISIFALTVGIFLPTVANRNITAKADTKVIEYSFYSQNDAPNYVESEVNVGDKVFDTWYRIYRTSDMSSCVKFYIETTGDALVELRNYVGNFNLKVSDYTATAEACKIYNYENYIDFKFAQDSKITIKLSNSESYSGYITQSESSFIEVNETIKKLTVPVKTIEEVSVDNVSKPESFEEIPAQIGDKIYAQWYRLYTAPGLSITNFGRIDNHTVSDIPIGIGFLKTGSSFYVMVNDQPILNLEDVAIFEVHDEYVDFFIKSNVFESNFLPVDVAGYASGYASITPDTIFTGVDGTLKKLVSTVEPETPGESVEPETPGESAEPETPGESAEPETPGESAEPETPGESVIESESKVDYLQDATDWVNQTLGLSLSAGALLFLIVVIFLIVKK